MIIIDKKKLILVSSLIFMCVFAFSITTSRIDDTVQTVALPVTNKVIVLDARASECQMSGAQSSSRNNRS